MTSDRAVARLLAFVLLIGPLARGGPGPGQGLADRRAHRRRAARGRSPRALEQRLAELGYVEGKNLLIDFRTAGGQLDRLPTLAAELVGRRPDVIVAVSTQAGMAAKNATRTIPIVLGAVGDPVGTGIVPSLARPGGNITGVSLLNAELSGKGAAAPEGGGAGRLARRGALELGEPAPPAGPCGHRGGGRRRSRSASSSSTCGARTICRRRSTRSLDSERRPSWCSPTPSPSPTGRRSSPLPPSAGCPPCIPSGRWWRKAD